MLPIIEVFIGLVLVFTLVSLMASVVNEWISGILNLRGRLLWRSIAEMLGTELGPKVEDHHLLRSLRSASWFSRFNAQRTKPDYVPRKAFLVALFDRLRSEGEPFPADLAGLKSSVAKLPKGGVRDSLSALIDSAGDSYDDAKENIGEYFDSVMAGLSGWYKRMSQVNLFFISLVLATVLGVDTLHIGRALWNDPVLRASAVAAAEKTVSEPPARLAEEKPGDADAAAAAEGGEPAASAVQVPEPSTAAEGGDGNGDNGDDDNGDNGNDDNKDNGDDDNGDNGADDKGDNGDDDGDSEEPGAREELLELLAQLEELRLPLIGFRTFAKQHCCEPAEEKADQKDLPTAIRAPRSRQTGLEVTDPGGAKAPESPCIRQYCFWVWLGRHLLGFFLTALAASVGAPFWFDLLNRLVNLRSTAKKAKEGGGEGR